MKAKALILTFLLSFLLQFAQLGALLHSVSHGDDTPSQSHVEKQLSTHKYCAQCLQFASLGNSTGYQITLRIQFHITDTPLTWRETSPAPRSRATIQARAPPFA
ncbi:MAG TPA: hypothetical protein VFM46_18595 [Pseudomonadales bacterium]|nr:hypothetical protein [Pseudomonadales bacterium]